jgi:hypothetical protein
MVRVYRPLSEGWSQIVRGRGSDVSPIHVSFSRYLFSKSVPAFVAQRIEHLTTDQKVGGSSPSKRTIESRISPFLSVFLYSSRFGMHLGATVNFYRDSSRKLILGSLGLSNATREII